MAWIKEAEGKRSVASSEVARLRVVCANERMYTVLRNFAERRDELGLNDCIVAALDHHTSNVLTQAAIASMHNMRYEPHDIARFERLIGLNVALLATGRGGSRASNGDTTQYIRGRSCGWLRNLLPHRRRKLH